MRRGNFLRLILAVADTRLGDSRRFFAGEKRALVCSGCGRVGLVDRVAHHQLQFPLARRECQFLCLFRCNLKRDGLRGALDLSLVLRLVDVLAAGQDLDVLQHDLRDHVFLSGLLGWADHHHDVNQGARVDEA